MTIRPIEIKDQDKLARLIRSVFEELEAPTENCVYDDPRTWHICESLQGVNARYWVLEEGDDIMGGCGYYPTEGLPEGHAELIKFYLSPTIRSRGYGTHLFTLVIDEARKAGYTHLYIESFPEFSKAVSMYERHGFVALPARLGHSGHKAANVFMLKSLLS
jgi:GNAT superfamily N-acetyltransferase